MPSSETLLLSPSDAVPSVREKLGDCEKPFVVALSSAMESVLGCTPDLLLRDGSEAAKLGCISEAPPDGVMEGAAPESVCRRRFPTSAAIWLAESDDWLAIDSFAMSPLERLSTAETEPLEPGAAKLARRISRAAPLKFAISCAEALPSAAARALAAAPEPVEPRLGDPEYVGLCGSAGPVSPVAPRRWPRMRLSSTEGARRVCG